MASQKTTQIKVNGNWYGCTKNLNHNTYRFTKNYQECSREEWGAAYKLHKDKRA
jgi:hypothetical protein